MSKINILPKNIAGLIAAGEVVERPCSVIKEMIENSIDAKATSITVEIKNGGITYMRITDNGSGIEKDDIKKVFISHATSKIKNENDLNSIGTLGFRGEAMASIATVAKVELLTKYVDEEIGNRYVIEGGEELDFAQAGCPKGTTIVVRDLFYNTPARMKFLKKDVTEGNAVAGVIDLISLSHPEISIRFIRDGKQVLLTNGDSNLRNTIYSVCGKEFAQSLMEVKYDLNGVKVTGFTCKPIYARSNRNMQYFFINGRFVKSKTCYGAISEAYKNNIMVGKFPACVLNVQIDTTLVDVNVHPAKIEVRFVNEKPVFESVYYGCKSAIEYKDEVKTVELKPQKNVANFFVKEEKPQQIELNKPKQDFWQEKSVNDFSKTQIMSKPVSYSNKDYSDTKPTQRQINKVNEILNSVVNIADNIKDEKVSVQSDTNENNAEKPDSTIQAVQQPEIVETPNFKLIGEAFKTYIIIEMNNELYFIDKHAAHERILFEELRAQKIQGTQILMVSQSVRLSKNEYSIILENLDLLEKAGFVVEDFGNSNVIVRECPTLLKDANLTDIIVEIAGKLLDNKTDLLPEKLDWVYHSMSCRGAVKAGDNTSTFEQEQFVKKLLSNPKIRYCPHGRPVMIKMTKYEIEKLFGRV